MERARPGQAGPLQRDRRGDGRSEGMTPTSTPCWPRWAPSRADRPRRRLGPRLPARAGDGRAALPTGDAPTVLSGGEAPCRAVQAAPAEALTCSCSMSRRTTSTPSRSSGSSSTWKYHGAVMAVTHDRYFLDNVAQWICEVDRAGSTPTRATTRRTWRRRASGCRSRARRTPSSPSGSGTSSTGCAPTPGPPGQRASSSAALRGDGRRGRAHAQSSTSRRSRSARSAPGSLVIEVDKAPQGLRRAGAHRRLSFTLPRNGIVGVIGPNGVGKTTLFKTIVGLEEADAGSVRIGDTVKISYVDQAAPGSTRRRTSGRSSPMASTTSGRPGRDPVPRIRLAVRFRGRTSRSRPACCPVASATGSTSR